MPDRNVIPGINWRKYKGWKGEETPAEKPKPAEWNPEDRPGHEYHGAPVEAREGISKEGLKASTPWGGMEGYEDAPEGGVFTDIYPRKGYGPDIWAVKTKVYPTEDSPANDDYFIPGNVHSSDVKRVGHWWHNPATGGKEVHWHKEEHCDGQSVHVPKPRTGSPKPATTKQLLDSFPRL
jgi:hypothetical protein